MKGNMKEPKVTIVIPTWNRKKDLIEGIRSVEKSTYKNVEIVVIDDASPDSTKETIEKMFPKVKVIKNKKNLGTTGSRNVGMKYAMKNSDYIMFQEDDVVLDKKAIEILMNVLTRNDTIGAVSPTMFYYDNPKRVQYAHISTNLWTGINEFGDPRDWEKPYPTPGCTGDFIIKTAAAKKVGFFDDLYRMYYEDSDYSARIWKAGFELYYVPKAKIWHKVPSLDIKKSTNRWLSHSYYTARNKIIFMKKYGKSFLVFCLFYPIYMVFYIYMALRYRRPREIINYFRGAIAGFRYH
ncbi:MAG: glycosyltransferase family 2 protein [Patescibacteria group bacterium]|jgi:hypothetical protein